MKKQTENAVYACLYHDIGKISIPDRILNKPERLSDEEYKIMKTHVTRGAEILKDFTVVEHVVDGALYHHERYDGLGYPDNIAGSAIPLEARILAVADVYDALRTKKPYHEPISHEKSFEVIKGGRELEFDYLIVKALKKVHNEFDEVWNKFSD